MALGELIQLDARRSAMEIRAQDAADRATPNAGRMPVFIGIAVGLPLSLALWALLILSLRSVL